MPRPIEALVHQDALAANLAVARRAATGAKVWAVVKADAYGHGIAQAHAAFAKADGFALLDPAEAVRLRELGWRGPVLLLEGCFDARDLETCARFALWHVVHCREQIDLLAALKTDRPHHVFLKMNSGMNRLGFAPDRLRAAWHRLAALAQVETVTLMTHLANADAGATWVRPGIALYGASPDHPAHTAADWGLAPAMTLRTELIATQTLAAGESIGYGAAFTAERPMRIGVAACGYADGYPRVAPAGNARGAPVLGDGRRSRIVGRVSMDMITVARDDLADAGVGSEVVLWGRSAGGAVLPIDEVAAAAGTLGYELMCARAPRVPTRAVP